MNFYISDLLNEGVTIHGVVMVLASICYHFLDPNGKSKNLALENPFFSFVFSNLNINCSACFHQIELVLHCWKCIVYEIH